MIFYFPSTWRRLIAHLADKAYIFLLQSPVFLMVATNFFKTDQLRIHWAHLLYLIGVSFLYEFLSLWFFSTTLGKRQWGLRVISRRSVATDLDLTCEQAFMRVLASKLSFFFGWAVYATAFFKFNRTHLADWLAETQVVSSTARSRAPKIRWLVGVAFIIFHAPESLKSASMTLNSFRWEKPNFVWHTEALLKWMEDLEISIEEFEDED